MENLIEYAKTTFGLTFHKAGTGTMYAPINECFRLRVANHPANPARTQTYEAYGLKTLDLDCTIPFESATSLLDRLYKFATTGEYTPNFKAGDRVRLRVGEGVVTACNGLFSSEMVTVEIDGQSRQFYSNKAELISK